MPLKPSHVDRAVYLRRRALLGIALLLVLVALAGLTVYLSRDDRPSHHRAAAPARPPSAAIPTASASPTPRGGALPAPPSTHDPVPFGKATAVALWSYDTRAYSRAELLAALHGWMTSDKKYADTASVDALIPSPVLWQEMASDGQYATATAYEAHFPASFTQALQADPGAITTAYVYAVTVTGQESIAWKGSPRGGAEPRATTLAVQCRPSRPCSLVGVLPNVAP